MKAIRNKTDNHWLWHGVIVVLFLLLALVPWSAWLSRRVDLSRILSLPSVAHPLGTDNLGRDLLLRISDAITGGIIPLWMGVIVGTLAGIAAATFAISIGSSKKWGYLIRSADALLVIVASIPIGIIAFAWAVYYEKAGILPVLLTLTVLFAIRTYLHMDNLYRQDHTLGYWEAHEVMGGKLHWRIWRYGILGQWKWSLLDSLGFHLKSAVAIEASLSYLGFGLQEPQASFGNMLASHFDTYMKGHPYVLILLVASLALAAAFPSSLVALLSRMLTSFTPKKTKPASADLFAFPANSQ